MLERETSRFLLPRKHLQTGKYSKKNRPTFLYTENPSSTLSRDSLLADDFVGAEVGAGTEACVNAGVGALGAEYVFTLRKSICGGD